MSEFRLVVGFVQLPFPYLGARRMSDILKITESSEMDPWRLGTRTIGLLRDGLRRQREFPGNSLVSPNMDQLLFFPCHLSRTARRFGRSSLTT